MSQNKRYGNFQLIGTVIGHPELAEARRGDVLKLEVGDDGRPTSELLAARTRPVGKTLSVDSETQESAAEYLADAEQQASDIIAKANADADAIRDAANAEVAELLKSAGKK